jgi:hypothetical protein
MRRYYLYSTGPQPSLDFLHQVGQFQQIVVAEQTPSSGQHHKGICGQDCRPAPWNRAQNAAAVVEVDTILSPVVAVGNQLEPLASQRMVWMDDVKGTVGTVGMRCS